MVWLKLDDNFFGDPKVVAAGRDARDLYLAGLTYCARHLTDGRIPAGALARIAADAEVGEAPGLADRLVDVGLWDREADGYLIPTFLKYNVSAEQVRTERDKARARKTRRTEGSPELRANSGSATEKERATRSGRSSASPARPVNPAVKDDLSSAAQPVPAPALPSVELRPGERYIAIWTAATGRKPRDATSDDQTAADLLAAQERDPELIAEVIAWMGRCSYHGDPARLKSVEKNWAKFLAERDANACRCGSNGVAPPAALPLSQHERLRRGIAHV